MAGAPAAIRSGTKLLTLPIPVELASAPAMLVKRREAAPAPGVPRRSKIWEFNTNLHCSIIGTCLSTGELRQTLKKLGLAPPESTDHELHGAAVTLAGRHDTAAKLLNKALDQRHRLPINQFAKVTDENSVRTLWREAVRRGEVPGAYWATLTHPATTPTLIREAFGEVHMLSHLVGAANRADIKRLCQLEADKSELEAKLERQQLALRQAVVTREDQIHELRQALAQRIAAQPISDNAGVDGESVVLRQLVADLERRLASETRRRLAAEARLADAQASGARDHAARIQAERDSEALRRELDALEGSLIADTDQPAEARAQADLADVTLLYVGGRPHQITHLRAVCERRGASFLHHDGGVENHTSLLPGLVSRADLILFPVDCISHEAAVAIKQLCRQVGKRFAPLRSASVASLISALRDREATRLAEAAD
jgi:hypothetical protein